MNNYAVKILADSISKFGVRLITLQATFPRFILAEINTHRVFSRNSASSRAIPPEKQIERVMTEPFIPETFNRRVKGMGVGEVLSDQEAARRIWLSARDEAATAASLLVDLDCDKSRINRLLEPFLWHTAIISSTEWDNFFALRDHPAAQPEFQILAKMMRQVIDGSVPTPIGEEGKVYEQWHLPLVERGEIESWDPAFETPKNFWLMVSAGRCARVSFDTQDNYEKPEDSFDRAQRLQTSGHLSPFEHVARPMALADHSYPDTGYCGNFRGWVQLRKMIPSEANFGELIEAMAS